MSKHRMIAELDETPQYPGDVKTDVDSLRGNLRSMKSISLIRPLVAVGCALAFIVTSSPASAATDNAVRDEISTTGDRCVKSKDRGKNGAKACFLDYAHGNDDGLWVKDIDRGGKRVAYAVVYEKHWYGPTHEVGETDGPDRGADRNMDFDIGDDNQIVLRVCERNPNKDYRQGLGDGCWQIHWDENEG